MATLTRSGADRQQTGLTPPATPGEAIGGKSYPALHFTGLNPPTLEQALASSPQILGSHTWKLVQPPCNFQWSGDLTLS